MLTNILSIAIQENLYDEIFPDKESPVKELLDEIKYNPNKSNLDIINKKIFQATKRSNLFSLALELLRDYYKQEGKELNNAISDPHIYFLLFTKFEKITDLIDNKPDITDKEFIKDLIYFIGRSIQIIHKDQIDLISADIYKYEQNLKPLQKLTIENKVKNSKNDDKSALIIISLFTLIYIVMLFVILFILITKQK